MEAMPQKFTARTSELLPALFLGLSFVMIVFGAFFFVVVNQHAAVQDLLIQEVKATYDRTAALELE